MTTVWTLEVKDYFFSNSGNGLLNSFFLKENANNSITVHDLSVCQPLLQSTWPFLSNNTSSPWLYDKIYLEIKTIMLHIYLQYQFHGQKAISHLKISRYF